MIFSPVGGVTSGQPPAEVAAPQANKEVGQQAFLQLLVAQIRNQNPLNPADGVEFLTQLAQFSQLEQSIGMRTELSELRSQVETIATAMSKAETENTGDTKNV